MCTDAGLLRRIEPAGHPARFERRVGDNHHHLVPWCGRTEDIDRVVG
jgi:Fur family transcriptional regulator, stress-responsive regulator